MDKIRFMNKGETIEAIVTIGKMRLTPISAGNNREILSKTQNAIVGASMKDCMKLSTSVSISTSGMNPIEDAYFTKGMGLVYRDLIFQGGYQ